MTLTQDRVPFLDFHAAVAADREGLQLAFDKVLDSGWFVMGRELAAFEEEFAAYCEADHCVGVGTGLDAIVLGLRALGVGPGDEVVVAAHTYIATWLAVEQVGATIVPVDASAERGLLDHEQLVAAISSRTKCIIAVHLYGHPEDMNAIRAIADERQIAVLEDAAQAHGARLDGRRIGSIADVTAFSFYPGKNLGAIGDGGAVTTNDPAIDDQVRLLRNYGSRKKYVNEIAGTNSRLDELHAAFMRTKLPRLDAGNARRAEVAQRYIAAVAGTEARICEPLPNAQSAWHLAPIWLERRDQLAEHLAADGIDTLIHYPIPPHHSEAFADRKFGPFPVAEQIARTTLSLPIGPYITDEQVDRVVESLRRFLTR
jgi:dTDP-4-amino-4,6-dideoxygalactose transaminase